MKIRSWAIYGWPLIYYWWRSYYTVPFWSSVAVYRKIALIGLKPCPHWRLQSLNSATVAKNGDCRWIRRQVWTGHNDDFDEPIKPRGICSLLVLYICFLSHVQLGLSVCSLWFINLTWVETGRCWLLILYAVRGLPLSSQEPDDKRTTCVDWRDGHQVQGRQEDRYWGG